MAWCGEDVPTPFDRGCAVEIRISIPFQRLKIWVVDHEQERLDRGTLESRTLIRDLAVKNAYRLS